MRRIWNQTWRWTLAALCMTTAQAQDKPLWELGLGVGGLVMPDYRGSDESRLYALPLPYVVYRGDWLKADREGARAQLFASDRVHLDLTLGASVPVSSHDNRARAGMPDLSASLGVGPALNVTLYRSLDQRLRWTLRLPVTYNVLLDDHWQGNGWQLAPHLNVDVRDPMGWSGWNLGMLVGPIYADRQRHAYFYDVSPAQALATRPAYRARGGYAGAQFIASASKRFDKVWVGAFLRYDTLQGAVFADSPLVKTRSYLMGGVGVAWVLGQSSTLVATPD